MTKAKIITEVRKPSTTKVTRSNISAIKTFDYTDDNLTMVTKGLRNQPNDIKRLIKIGAN